MTLPAYRFTTNLKDAEAHASADVTCDDNTLDFPRLQTGCTVAMAGGAARKTEQRQAVQRNRKQSPTSRKRAAATVETLESLTWKSLACMLAVLLLLCVVVRRFKCCSVKVWDTVSSADVYLPDTVSRQQAGCRKEGQAATTLMIKPTGY